MGFSITAADLDLSVLTDGREGHVTKATLQVDHERPVRPILFLQVTKIRPNSLSRLNLDLFVSELGRLGKRLHLLGLRAMDQEGRGAEEKREGKSLHWGLACHRTQDTKTATNGAYRTSRSRDSR